MTTTTTTTTTMTRAVPCRAVRRMLTKSRSMFLLMMTSGLQVLRCALSQMRGS
jgi:hypothetical protein